MALFSMVWLRRLAADVFGSRDFALQWLGFFVMTLVLWIPFLVRHMCTDGYAIAVSQRIIIAQSSANGRPLAAVVAWLAQLAGFNLASDHVLSVMIGIIIFSLATTILFRLLRGRLGLSGAPALIVAAIAFFGSK